MSAKPVARHRRPFRAAAPLVLLLLPATAAGEWTKFFACPKGVATPVGQRLLMSPDAVKALAAKATQVKICTGGNAAECVTSKPNTFPIVNLRQLLPISNPNAQSACGPSCVAAAWAGPPALLAKLWSSCRAYWAVTLPTHTSPDLQSALLYQSCGNVKGLHIIDGVPLNALYNRCGWTWEDVQPTDSIEVYVGTAQNPPCDGVPSTVYDCECGTEQQCSRRQQCVAQGCAPFPASDECGCKAIRDFTDPRFLQCNWFGDPHFHRTFQEGWFDYQGLGVYRMASTDPSRCGKGFELQYFTCPFQATSFNRNSVTVALAVKFGDAGTVFLTNNRIENPGGRVSIIGALPDDTIIRSDDQCAHVIVNRKQYTWGGGTFFYYNVQTRVFKADASDEGICGTAPDGIHAAAQYVPNGPGNLFTEEQMRGVCAACQKVVGRVPPNCLALDGKPAPAPAPGGDAGDTPESACGDKLPAARVKCTSVLKPLASSASYQHLLDSCLVDFCASGMNPAFADNAASANMPPAACKDEAPKDGLNDAFPCSCGDEVCTGNSICSTTGCVPANLCADGAEVRSGCKCGDQLCAAGQVCRGGACECQAGVVSAVACHCGAQACDPNSFCLADRSGCAPLCPANRAASADGRCKCVSTERGTEFCPAGQACDDEQGPGSNVDDRQRAGEEIRGQFMEALYAAPAGAAGGWWVPGLVAGALAALGASLLLVAIAFKMVGSSRYSQGWRQLAAHGDDWEAEVGTGRHAAGGPEDDPLLG